MKWEKREIPKLEWNDDRDHPRWVSLPWYVRPLEWLTRQISDETFVLIRLFLVIFGFAFAVFMQLLRH